jgi:hypothetical protein
MNEAKDSPKRQKKNLRTPINGKFNDISSPDLVIIYLYINLQNIRIKKCHCRAFITNSVIPTHSHNDIEQQARLGSNVMFRLSLRHHQCRVTCLPVKVPCVF